MKKRTTWAAFAVGALLAGVSTWAAAAETKGPVTDELGVVAIPKGDPVVIGGYWVLSGSDTALGLDQKRGAEIAFDDLNNTIAGHPIQFAVEDESCSAEGGQTAANKLSSMSNVIVVLGPSCSSAATAAAPVLWRQGIVSIGTSAAAPSLTAPDRKPAYFGYMRTVFSDGDQGLNDASYFYNQLKCTTLATINDGSPYTSEVARAAGKRFTELGGKVVAEEAVAPTDVDMRPVLTSISTKSPCVLYFPDFTSVTAQILRQAPEIAGLKNTKLFAGAAALSPGLIEAAGDAVKGARLTSVDLSPEARGVKYPDFLVKHTKKYGEAPATAYHAQAYDAAMVAAKAIEAVAKTDAQGTTYIGKKALRDALFATKGYEGISGPINCNENGQCGSFKFAVYEFTDGDPKTFNVGKNPKKIFPAN